MDYHDVVFDLSFRLNRIMMHKHTSTSYINQFLNGFNIVKTIVREREGEGGREGERKGGRECGEGGRGKEGEREREGGGGRERESRKKR